MPIKTYVVAYNAGGTNTSGNPYRATITLLKDDGSVLGSLFFHRSATTLPSSDSQSSNGSILCHYTWEDFPQVLDLLRNESPVHVGYNATFKVGQITTSTEEAGEGEPV